MDRRESKPAFVGPFHPAFVGPFDPAA